MTKIMNCLQRLRVSDNGKNFRGQPQIEYHHMNTNKLLLLVYFGVNYLLLVFTFLLDLHFLFPILNNPKLASEK